MFVPGTNDKQLLTGSADNVQQARGGEQDRVETETIGVERPRRQGVPQSDARRAFQLAGAKLPIKTRFATRFAEEKVQ